MDDGAFTDGWEPTRATLVSVRPGSIIRATGGTTKAPDFSNSDEPGVAAMTGRMDGLSCSMTGQSGANILNGLAGKTFRGRNEVCRLWTADRDGDPIFACMGKETAAAGSFTDVKADAGYDLYPWSDYDLSLQRHGWINDSGWSPDIQKSKVAAAVICLPPPRPMMSRGGGMLDALTAVKEEREAGAPRRVD